jgi:hypothetical protein
LRGPGRQATLGVMDPRPHLLVCLALSLLTVACASSPQVASSGPCPACAACEAPPPPPQPAVPALVDLRSETPSLDRARAASLEAFSADGALALLRVDDSARGLAFLVLTLDGSAPPRALPADGGLERDARQKGLKTLGPRPVTHWSSRHPVTGLEVDLSEREASFAVLTEVAGSTERFPLALLPRHVTTGGAEGPLPASLTARLLAWAPGGRHLLVVYGQLTLDVPAVRADRWFVLDAPAEADAQAVPDR